MRFRSSLLFPIFGVILFVAAGTVLSSYYFELETLRNVLRKNDIKRIAKAVESSKQELSNELERAALQGLTLARSNALPAISASPPATDIELSALSFGLDLAAVYDQNANLVSQAHSILNDDDTALLGELVRSYAAALKSNASVRETPRLAAHNQKVFAYSISPLGDFNSERAVSPERISGYFIYGQRLDNTFAAQIAGASGVDICLGLAARPEQEHAQGVFACSSVELRDKVHADALRETLPGEKNIVLHPDERTIIHYSAIPLGAESIVLVAGLDTSDTANILNSTGGRLVVSSAIVLVLAIICGAFYAAYLLKPLNQLRRRAEKTVREITGESIKEYPGNEIQSLVKSFNEMVERLSEYISERSVLQENTGRYQFIVNASADAMCLIDENFMVEAVNRSLCIIVTREPHELVGQHVRNLLGDRHFMDAFSTSLAACFNGEEAHFEDWFAFYEERLRCYKIDLYPYISTEGQVSHAALIMQDITDRKHAEEQLQQAHDELEHRVEERTRELQETNVKLHSEIMERVQTEKELQRRDVILNAVSYAAQQFLQATAWDTHIRDVLGTLGAAASVNRAVLFVNDEPGADATRMAEFFTWALGPECELSAASSGPISLENAENISFSDPGASRWARELCDRSTIYGRVEDFPETERALLSQRGALSVVMAPVFVPVADGDERWWGVLMLEDCNQSRSWFPSEIHALEAATAIIGNAVLRSAVETDLVKAKNAAEQASQAKSLFLANMSHEIRTPLNGIMGMTDLGMETDLGETQRHIFETINAEANVLLGLINEVLDLSKIEAGKLKLEYIPFNLQYLLEDLSASLAIRAHQKGLEFISYLEPGTPTRLLGDPGRLRQILVNLAGNALKFTHEGEVVIRGEMLDSQDEQVVLRLSVSDTGIGIPEDKQSLIFESFTQADGATTRKYGGSGLGTTIAKHFAELMEGEIGVNSTVGEGSEFWFTVAFDKQPASDVHAESPAVELENLGVLVADDNHVSRRALGSALQDWGCSVHESDSVEKAMEELKYNFRGIDLAILDLKSSGGDSFELAYRIRWREATAQLPIIVLSTLGRRGDSMKCREIGVNGYLTKPIRRDALLKAIQSVLGRAVASLAPGESAHASGADAALITKHSVAESRTVDACILLVEDYPTNQEIAMHHLREAGMSVDLARNGREALVLFGRKHYDLVLMDLQMPELDGFEATAELRRLEEKKHAPRTPIIAMTAEEQDWQESKRTSVGMDDFLPKPLHKAPLLEKVLEWLNRAESAETAPHNEEHPPPFDYAEALERFEGDEAFLLEIAHGFVRRLAAELPVMRQRCKANQEYELRKLAHELQGDALELGAETFAALVQGVEQAAKNNTYSEASNLLDTVEQELPFLSAFIKTRQGRAYLTQREGE